MPLVEEANSISEELDKRVKFEILLVAPEVVGNQKKGKTEVRRSCFFLLIIQSSLVTTNKDYSYNMFLT